MSFGWWVVVGLAVIGGYTWYASIVRRKNRVMEALAGIDVQLQQRHDLIPNVLTIARRFMEHERQLLTEITDLRAKAHQQVGERNFAKVAEHAPVLPDDGGGTRFSLPGAMAEANTLVVELPKRMGTADLFEPPSYWKPAGGHALVRLQNDIRKVLDMTDTVIHLDFWASGRQRDVARASKQAGGGVQT